MTRGHRTESRFIRHEPCPKCGSRDNLARYSDGHAYCMGCAHYEHGDGASPDERPSRQTRMDFIQHAPQSLDKRRISKTTCERYGYGIGQDMLGRVVQVADYYDADGQRVAQKLRYPNKDFKVVGDISRALPFGAQAHQRVGKRLFVTEGEIDALSLATVLGDWPVVSIPTGAGPQVRKYLAGILGYLHGFEEVVLVFDSDEPGRAAAKTACEVIGRRAKVARLPLKDANEMLVAGRTEELRFAVFNGESYRPEEVVVASEMLDRALDNPGTGFLWTLPSLNTLTLGRRTGELVGIGAGTGVGKTEFILDCIRQSLTERPVAAYLLEQAPEETGLRLGGKLIGKPLHEGDASPDDIRRGFAALKELHPLYLYDAFGGHAYDSIEQTIRYNYEYHGVQDHWLDHLTALAAVADDERTELERIMAQLGGLVAELPIVVTFVSHLATPEGKPHEEGGRVAIRHFKGSRAIGFWSHTMFGLERDQQADDPAIRGKTTCRILKCRRRGRATGLTVDYWLDEDGTLTENIPASLADSGPAPSPFPADADADF